MSIYLKKLSVKVKIASDKNRRISNGLHFYIKDTVLFVMKKLTSRKAQKYLKSFCAVSNKNETTKSKTIFSKNYCDQLQSQKVHI